MTTPETEIVPLARGALVRPAGPRFDAASAPALKNTVVDLANRGKILVVISLSRLTHVDSSGLGVLISLHKTLQASGGRLALCETPAKILPILRLTRLDRVLTISPDAQTAATLIGAD